MIRNVGELRAALDAYPDDMKFIFPPKLHLSKHGRDFFDDEAEAKAEYETTGRTIEAGWHKDGHVIYSARFEGLSIHDDIGDWDTVPFGGTYNAATGEFLPTAAFNEMAERVWGAEDGDDDD